MKVIATSFRTWRIYKNDHFEFVYYDEKGFHCSCDDYTLNYNKNCEHIKYVKEEINWEKK